MLNEFAVPARNAATLGKLNEPVVCRKLLLKNCRYSPPMRSECGPTSQLTVSAITNVVSPRPEGWFAGPPKLRLPPAILNCDSPIGSLTPLRMPKSAGLRCDNGVLDE